MGKCETFCTAKLFVNVMMAKKLKIDQLCWAYCFLSNARYCMALKLFCLFLLQRQRCVWEPCASFFRNYFVTNIWLLLATGLLTAVHKDYFKVLNNRELFFNDFGDRVAQLLHVESVVPFWQSRSSNMQQQIIIVNTHLLFPHDSTLSIVRLHQVPNCPISIMHCIITYLIV